MTDEHIPREELAFIEAETRTFYSEEDIVAICREARLPMDDGPTVKAGLDASGREWFRLAYLENTAAKEVRRELAALRAAAAKLADVLASTTGDAWDALLHARDVDTSLGYSIHLRDERPDQFVPGKIVIADGDPLHHERLADLSISALQITCRGLVRNSEYAELAIMSPGRGRRASRALGEWMASIHRLWTEELGQSFTQGSQSDGSPTTRASAFCVEAFKVLDPKMPPQRVHNEMRKRIKFIRHFRDL